MKRNILPILFIVAISIAIYANTLKNGFVSDDAVVIMDSILIRNFHNIPKLFEKAYFPLSGEMSYRPVVTFTYFLDEALYGLEPRGYHLTNIFLHAANGVLFYAFLTLLFDKSNMYANKSGSIFLSRTLLISLLFATHPVSTEAVNVISFREDLLTFLFYMATFCLYLVATKSRGNKKISGIVYFLSYTTYLLALLSKEMAVTLPIVIYCYERVCGDRERLCSKLFGYIVITAFYFYIRFHLLFNPLEGSIPALGMTERFLAIPWLVFNYLKLALFPISLSADYRFTQSAYISSAFTLIIGVAFAIIAIKIRKVSKEIAFGIFSFLITLMPVYNIIPIINPFAERYLYLPIASFAIVVGSLIYLKSEFSHPDSRFRYFYVVVFFITISSFSLLVIKRNTVWKDEYSLWSDTVKKQPANSVAHNWLGFHYYKKGQLAKAIKEYEIAIELNPNNSYALDNIGQVLYQGGQLDDAVQAFKSALSLNPNQSLFHYHIGRVYVDQGRLNDAIKEYELALRLKPDFFDAQINLNIANYLKERQKFKNEVPPTSVGGTF